VCDQVVSSMDEPGLMKLTIITLKAVLEALRLDNAERTKGELVRRLLAGSQPSEAQDVPISRSSESSPVSRPASRHARRPRSIPCSRLPSSSCFLLRCTSRCRQQRPPHQPASHEHRSAHRLHHGVCAALPPASPASAPAHTPAYGPAHAGLRTLAPFPAASPRRLSLGPEPPWRRVGPSTAPARHRNRPAATPQRRFHRAERRMR
jgi:hypothetical protein